MYVLCSFGVKRCVCGRNKNIYTNFLMSQKEKPKRQTRIELLPCGGVGGNDMKETGMEVRFLGLPFYLVLTFEM